jgi:hypothetical protein
MKEGEGVMYEVLEGDAVTRLRGLERCLREDGLERVAGERNRC